MNEQQTGKLIEKVDNIALKVDRIDTTLHGNGREGLVYKVVKHDQTLGVFKKALWVLLTAIVGVIVIAAL